MTSKYLSYSAENTLILIDILNATDTGTEHFFKWTGPHAESFSFAKSAKLR